MPAHTTRDIIQDARDQLVGKVPLPIDQCHEITRALVYKFLSAADTEAIKLSGEPTYFVDVYSESHWDRLMAPEQTANEIQRRYTAGLTMLGSREDIPPAFQTIYQDAFMPYNDPIILRDFLGIINRFNTNDTESIGDAYETMLQYLGAQASAGQFRTPRHIIDFIVGIVNPEKHDTILDPAWARPVSSPQPTSTSPGPTPATSASPTRPLWPATSSATTSPRIWSSWPASTSI